MEPRAAFVVSVGRGLAVSGIFIYLLPQLFGADAIWLAMPLTEALTAVYVVRETVKYTRRLPA